MQRFHQRGPAGETWHDVLTKLNRGEMPPEKEPRPSAADRRTLVGWLTTQLKIARELRGGERGTLRRLTRYEYANTMRDLIGIDLDYAADLPPDPSSKDGFRNNGTALGMSPIQIQTYLAIARNALAKAIVTGPEPEVFRHHADKSTGKPKKKKG